MKQPLSETGLLHGNLPGGESKYYFIAQGEFSTPEKKISKERIRCHGPQERSSRLVVTTLRT